MRQYTVRAGDTPASIASRDDMAGCPKCSVDLVHANPHKPIVTHPNGFITFRELRAGEKLNLPEKWFDGSLDKLPKSYFAALPHPDGVTHVGIGAPPYSDALVAAANRANAALEADNNAGLDYCVTVSQPGSTVNSAVHAFKLLWNATQSPPVPINTGNFESETAHALQNVIQDARGWWDPCPSRAKAKAPPLPMPAPVIIPPQQKTLSKGDMAGYGLLAAGALGGGVYLLSRRGRKWH